MLTITQELRNWLVDNRGVFRNASDDVFRTAAVNAIKDGSLTVAKAMELMNLKAGDSGVGTLVKGAFVELLQNGDTAQGGAPTASKLFAAAGEDNGNIRVKAGSEMYSGTKSVGRHVKTGQPVTNERGMQIELPSQRELAKIGALYKFFAMRDRVANIVLSEHEKSLVDECFTKDRWCGNFNGQWLTGIDGQQVKGLFSDTLSGGLELVPEFFDEAVVSFPLLNGELYPFVDQRTVPRGNQIEGASIGNPTVVWGTSEGTDIPLFDTDDLVASIDTSIHPVTAAVEVGRDFLSDSPVEAGQLLVANVGQSMLSSLDRVIANGNGTSEPTGIFVAAGLTAVNSENGNGGPATVSDYERLMFGVGKQYRNPAMRCAFIANDTSYQRARGIEVGTTDQRRVFGMDHQSYMLLEHPFRIQNDLPNTKRAFGALSKYRMYRRQGAEVRWVDGGKELARQNKLLLIVRGRYGGQIVDGNAFAVTTDGEN